MKKILFKWLIIPLFLAFIGLFLSINFFFNSDINPNVLSHNETADKVISKNNIISGKFKASDNYLGIISVRFNKENLSGDSVFQLKNVLEEDWYHTATISAVQYNTLPFYSFGFPIIEKSKDQTYQFQIKLLSGNRGLSLSREEPVLVTDYAYPKEILLKNPSLLIEFIRKKIAYYVNNNNSWKIFLLYSLPLILYILYFSIFHKFISRKNKLIAENFIKNLMKPSIIIPIILMAVDIFIVRKYSDNITSFLTLLWMFAVITYRMDARISFGLALIFLVFCPFLLSVPMDWNAEKSAIWAYMMLVVGTFQSIVDISPILQKTLKTKFVQFLIKFIRAVLTTFDLLIITSIIFIKNTFILLIKLIFNRLPNTFIGWLIFIGKLFLLIIISFIFLISVIFITLKIRDNIRIINHKKIRLSMNPTIEAIEPKLVYKGTKIVVYGKGFGWDDKRSQILIDGKKIDGVSWTDSKIIFPVPLHWKTGVHKIWIEKKIDWDGKIEIGKSQIFEIKVLPVTDKITKDDELYFEQLKTWKPETRKLNGYE
jgi:hypothetical protein